LAVTIWRDRRYQAGRIGRGFTGPGPDEERLARMQMRIATSADWPSHQLTPVSNAWPVAPPDPDAWPNLWARCWARIRSWKVPPRWSLAEWRDEARAQGALAACEALHDFNPARGVPRSAFLYQKVIAAAWTRYRQEWSFGRRSRDLAPIDDRAEPESARLDPETIERLASALEQLSEADRRLIVHLFWDGRTEDELAATHRITRQAINKRKRLLLLKLGALLGFAP
jgi:RNA polymerase sigma factor (sigma-70 family)